MWDIGVMVGHVAKEYGIAEYIVDERWVEVAVGYAREGAKFVREYIPLGVEVEIEIAVENAIAVEVVHISRMARYMSVEGNLVVVVLALLAYAAMLLFRILYKTLTLLLNQFHTLYISYAPFFLGYYRCYNPICYTVFCQNPQVRLIPNTMHGLNRTTNHNLPYRYNGGISMTNYEQTIRNEIWGLDTPVKLESGIMVPAVNLDNAATTPALLKVMKEIDNQMKLYGSIGRGRGQKSAHSTDFYVYAREAILEFVGAEHDKYTVFYAANTTDGINKLASALIKSKSDMILTTRMEHHANDLPWRAMGRTVYAEVDQDGRLKTGDIERLLRQYRGKIKYVAITAASNVTGYVNEVHHIARLAHMYGAKIIVDGAQIAAHREIEMMGCTPEEDIDFFVFSAHKMYAPYGGGAVVGLKNELDKHIPAFYGGGMVEAVFDSRVCYTPAPDSYEAGSPNYPGLVSMVCAAKMLKQYGFDEITRHEQHLLQRAITGLKQIPGVQLYGDNDYIGDRVGIVVFNMCSIASEDMADYLANKHGIAVRHGAFCAHPYVRRLTKEAEHSGCAPPKGMVRASFGIYNNEADVDALIAAVGELGNASTPAAIMQGHSRVAKKKMDSHKPFDRG